MVPELVSVCSVFGVSVVSVLLPLVSAGLVPQALRMNSSAINGMSSFFEVVVLLRFEYILFFPF